MQDTLIRATAANGQIRAMAVLGTTLVEEARRRHDLSVTATAALGRTLMGALLLGANLKGEDTITVRVMGDGPLGAVVAHANAAGDVRGYVQEPQADVPSKTLTKLDVGTAVGKNGFLYVTKDLGLKDPYTGSAPLQSGEIAEDFTYYLATSEQIPSIVALGVLVNTDRTVLAAAGYIIQVMPGASEEVIAELEAKVTDVEPVSNLAERGLSPENILREVLGKWEFKVLEEKPVAFTCRCTREKLEKILISLGQEELESIIREQGEAELICHFCGDKYIFEKNALENLLAEAK